MPNNLLLRGSRYSVRLFIPNDLRAYVGRAEIIKSLGTRSRRHAKLLLRGVQRVAERLFFYARVGVVDKGKLAALLTQYIENALVDWQKEKDRLKSVDFDLSETVGQLYLSGKEQSFGDQFQSIADGARQDFFVRGRKDYICGLARLHLKNDGMHLDGEEFDRFCEQFAKVYVYANEELAKREAEGRYSYNYREFVEGMLAEERPVSLKQAVDEWLELKQVKGLADGSMGMYTVNTNLILRFYGDDYAVKRLNNRELLRFVQHEQRRRVKNTTIQKRVRLLKDVVKTACAEHGLIPHTYRVELKDDAADVKPYTTEELHSIFLLLNKFRAADAWKYWGVLIGLLGGLRREEFLMLRPDDIKSKEGIWFFDIRDAKTDAGIRWTPVSSCLVRLGFLDYVIERQKSCEPYLLMCRLPKPKSSYCQVPLEKFSDFFRNMRVKHSIVQEVGENEKKTLHSLRHNYSDSLKQAGVRPDIVDELCGHEHAPGSMRSIYDEKFGLDVLAENLEKAKWECDFSLLRTYSKVKN